jgi:hypothetical protein
LIALVFLATTDVGNACFLVFIHIKDSFSWHRRPLDLVRRECRRSAVAWAFAAS